MSVDCRKIAACFDLADGGLDEISKQFHEVVSLLGVRVDQQEFFQKFVEIYDKVFEVVGRARNGICKRNSGVKVPREDDILLLGLGK